MSINLATLASILFWVSMILILFGWQYFARKSVRELRIDPTSLVWALALSLLGHITVTCMLGLMLARECLQTLRLADLFQDNRFAECITVDVSDAISFLIQVGLVWFIVSSVATLLRLQAMIKRKKEESFLQDGIED